MTKSSVKAAGVHRSICEWGGQISVRFVTEVSGPIYRAGSHDRPTATRPHDSPFSDELRMGVRRRDDTDPHSLLLIARPSRRPPR